MSPLVVPIFGVIAVLLAAVAVMLRRYSRQLALQQALDVGDDVTKPPAGESGFAPVPAWPHPPERPPLPGPHPAHPHDCLFPGAAGAPVPPARRPEDIAAHARFIRCGCVDLYDTGARNAETFTCNEHTFDVAEWEARLP